MRGLAGGDQAGFVNISGVRLSIFDKYGKRDLRKALNIRYVLLDLAIFLVLVKLIIMSFKNEGI